MDFDAASQHPSNMLENLNMLKHHAGAVILTISTEGASKICLFFLRFSMQNGFKKKQVFGIRVSLRFTLQKR